MAIEYRIYGNDLAGGPIDYGTPLATVPGLSWASPPIPPGSDARFAVRARDDATGLEELNTDASVRIITDAGGVDRTARPLSPSGLEARATAGGGARVEWFQPAAGPTLPPAAFKIWVVEAPGPIDYAAAPTATALYRGNPPHSAEISGLSDGITYLIAVRAINPAGDDGNLETTTVVGSAVGPAAVEGLSAGLA